MQKYSLSWQPTDAQFLEALSLAAEDEKGATLQDILLMADAIDGAVFSLEEVTVALEKLVAANLVQVQKRKITLEPVFAKALEHIFESEDAQHKILEKLETSILTEQGILSARTSLKSYKLKKHYQQYQEQFG